MPERGKKKNNLFLPQAANDHFFILLAGGRAWGPEREPARELEPEPEPETPAGLYPCPCCGCRTFPAPREEAMAYICPVCLWENDVFDPGEDAPSPFLRDPFPEYPGAMLCRACGLVCFPCRLLEKGKGRGAPSKEGPP